MKFLNHSQVIYIFFSWSGLADIDWNLTSERIIVIDICQSVWGMSNDTERSATHSYLILIPELERSKRHVT